MLLPPYYAQNYAGIIGSSLQPTANPNRAFPVGMRLLCRNNFGNNRL